MTHDTHHPTRVARWLAQLLLRGPDAVDVRQDLDELYARDRARGSTAAAAHRRYLRHLFASALSLWRAALPMLPRVRGLDVRVALRSLARAPWFTLACVTTIALSIALAATVFAVVDGVLFKPLPYPDADRLALLFRAIDDPVRREQLREGTGRAGSQFSAADLDSWRQADSRLSVSAFAVNFGIGPVAGIGISDETTWAARVDRAFFEVLGRRPLVGGFSDEHYRLPFQMGKLSAHPAVISYRLWRRWQPDGGLPRDLLRVGDGTLQVVGVLPHDFVFPMAFGRTAPDVLLPLEVTSEVRALQGIVRLDPYVSLATAAEQLRGAVLEPVESALGTRERPAFRLMFGAVVAVILLASLNVAALLAARGRDRAVELAVRSALGASAGRLIQLMLVEALAIALAGAAIGVLAAEPLLNLATVILPSGYLLMKPPAIDLRVVAFAVVSAAATLLAFGAWPAVRAARASAVTGVRQQGSTTRSRTIWRRVALAAQSAIGILVVLAGTLLVAGFATLWQEDVGLDREGTAVVDVTARSIDDPVRRQAVMDEAVRIARRTPDVDAASALTGPFLRNAIAGSSASPPPGARDVIAQDVAVASGFFETAGIRLLSGRFPTDQELDGGRPVAVVSEGLARAYWPDREPLGQVLSAPGAALVVVGVATDVRIAGLEEQEKTAEIYLPMRVARPARDRVLLLRTRGNADAVARQVAAAILRERPELMVTRAESIDSALSSTVRTRQFQSTLFGAFAVATLALLGAGMFGVVAMHTASRSREIGVRMALGATASAVRRMVVVESLIPVLAGILLGGAVAWWTTGLLANLIYGVAPHSPRLWSTAAAFVVTTAALAAWLPSLRASRIDPQSVLRTQ